jgi:hypothetical protein
MGKLFQLRLGQITVAQLDGSQFVKDHGEMFSAHCRYAFYYRLSIRTEFEVRTLLSAADSLRQGPLRGDALSRILCSSPREVNTYRCPFGAMHRKRQRPIVDFIRPSKI